MNSFNSQDYGYAPNAIKEKAVESERFRDIYNVERYERADVEKDKKLRRKLRELLKIGEKVLALPERLKKKDVPGNLYKSTTENISFFNLEQVFVVKKIVKISNTINYHYWISKEGEHKAIDERFLRKELFALNDQFVLKMEPVFICYKNLSCDQNKRFTLEFSDGNLLEDVIFKKNKEYYITSMSSYVDLTVDVTKLLHSDKIKEVSDLANAILVDGVDFDYKKKCYTNKV